MTVLERILKAVDRRDDSVKLQAINNAETSELKTKLAQGEFSEAMQLLLRLQDNQNGIKHYLIAADHETPTILLRDAPAVVDNPRVDQRIVCLQQILGLLRGAELLNNDNQNAESKLYLTFLASLAYRELYAEQPLPPQEVLERINTYLVAHVALTHTISLNEAKQRLQVARDFASLEQPTHVVATRMVDPVDGGQLYEIDIPKTKPTTQQRQDYKALTDQSKRDHQRPYWYRCLQPWEQRLVKKFSRALANGEHRIPSRLSKQLIGVPGHYVRQLCIVRGENKTVYEVSHAATPAYRGPDSRASVPEHDLSHKPRAKQTKENMRQLHAAGSANAAPAKPLILHTRKAETHRRADHQAAVALLQDTALDSANSTTLQAQAVALLQLVCNDQLKVKTGLGDRTRPNPINDVVKAYLLHGKGSHQAAWDIAFPSSSTQTSCPNTFKPVMAAAFNCRRLLATADNSHAHQLQLAAALVVLTQELQHSNITLPDGGQLPDEFKQLAQLTVLSNSGTPELGLYLSAATHANQQAADQRTAQLAKAGHAQFMAAASGDNAGGMGFRASRLRSFPTAWKDLKRYFYSPLAKFAGRVPTSEPENELKLSIDELHEKWQQANSLDAKRELIDTLLGIRVMRTEMKGRRWYHKEVNSLEKTALLTHAREQLKTVNENEMLAFVEQLKNTHQLACELGGMNSRSTGRLLTALYDAVNRAEASKQKPQVQTDFFADSKHHLMKLELARFNDSWDDTKPFQDNKTAVLRVLRLAKERTERKGLKLRHDYDLSQKKVTFLDEMISKIDLLDDAGGQGNTRLKLAIWRNQQTYQRDYSDNFGKTGFMFDELVKVIGPRPVNDSNSDGDGYEPPGIDSQQV